MRPSLLPRTPLARLLAAAGLFAFGMALGAAPLSAQAGHFQVSQWDPGTSAYVPLGVISPYATADDILAWYGYDGDHNNIIGGPALASDRAHLFLVESGKSGLSLVYVLDQVGDGSGGRAELRVDLDAAPGARWIVKDDPLTPTLLDDHTGRPGELAFAAIHGWGTAFSDGGVIGNLDGCEAPLTFTFTDFDGTPGDEIDGLDTFVAASGDGSEIALVLETDRPVRLTPIKGHRVSTYDTGLGTWVEQGCVMPFPVDGGVADFVQYDGNHHNIDPLVFVPTSDRTHLLMLDTTEDGLCLLYLHDQTSDGSGGHAEMIFDVQDDADGLAWIHQDDPYNPLLVDDYTGQPGWGQFTSIHQWNTIFADGGALGALDNGWSALTAYFHDLDGTPGNEMDGLTSWGVHSADGSAVELPLAVDLLARIEPCCYPGMWDDLGCALGSAFGTPRLVGTGILAGNSPNWVTLMDARPNRLGLLFVSIGVGAAPFKGGVLKPVPVLTSFLIFTGPGGGFDFAFNWPAGFEGVPFCLQAAIDDDTAVAGVALSNALTFTAE